MQHLLITRSLPLRIILPVVLTLPVFGFGAAWLSARLANGVRPEPRLIFRMIGVGGLLTASALVARPADIAWSLGLGWTLAILGSVDLAAFRLPDVLTLPLMGLGLVRAVAAGDDPAGHAAGLLGGYAVLAMIGWVFLRLRKRHGIGLGDAKLFAAAGAWLGWAALPAVMLIACGLGLAWFAVTTLRSGRQALRARMAFGVALSVATWVIWLRA